MCLKDEQKYIDEQTMMKTRKQRSDIRAAEAEPRL